ncbi:RepB family plasmid replication initiator protein [Candidatus Parcubacteria bacterium]|nr:MAG: RepB family plasmid replication initiator protein [Candidatus Parcubacteria bacterium]
MNDLEARLKRLRAQAEAKAAQKQRKTKDDLRHELVENAVTKSNRLARAYYRFDIVEKRIMEAMISKLDSRLAKKEQMQDIRLDAKEYAEAFGIKRHKAYEEMAEAVHRLMRTVITIKESDDIKREYTLMAEAVYHKGKGHITATFNPKIARHLVNLRKHFVSYQLKKGANFKSSYTWRLFEIMMSWKQSDDPVAGWFTISIEELKEMLGAPKNYRWINLKQRALDKAIEEIDQELNIKVWYEPVKRGRKIEMLRFNFMEDKQQRLNLSTQKCD